MCLGNVQGARGDGANGVTLPERDGTPERSTPTKGATMRVWLFVP